jgi:hypothetical protein
MAPVAEANAEVGLVLVQAPRPGAQPGLYVGGRQVLTAPDVNLSVVDTTPAYRDIFEAMACSRRRRFEFATPADLLTNIRIRANVVATMREVAERSLKISFVTLTRDSATGTVRGDFGLPAAGWRYTFNNPHGSVVLRGGPLTWLSRDGVSASAALDSLRLPGVVSKVECLTGVQLVVLTGVMRTLGSTVFDGLHPLTGGQPALRGIGVPIARPAQRPDFSADRHLILIRSLPSDSPQGPSSPRIAVSDMVPGDYVYMSNLPDYERRHPGGAWNGENAIAMSRSSFYGLGLEGLKTEAQLRQDLAAGYNAGLPQDVRPAEPAQMRWTVLASPVSDGDRREAGPFVR